MVPNKNPFQAHLDNEKALRKESQPLTQDQRIHIAADYDSERVKLIRELMEEVFNAARKARSSYDQLRYNYFDFQDYITGNDQFNQQTKQ